MGTQRTAQTPGAPAAASSQSLPVQAARPSARAWLGPPTATQRQLVPAARAGAQPAATTQTRGLSRAPWLGAVVTLGST